MKGTPAGIVALICATVYVYQRDVNCVNEYV